MSDNKAAYGSSQTITTSLATLATSSTLVAGWSSAEVDNTSGLYLDRPVSGVIQVGTTPTINTNIEVWCIPKLSDSTYADTFDGTSKAVTVTSRGILLTYGILLSSILVDSTTTNRNYYFWSSISGKCGTLPPKKYQIFIVHNTGASLSGSGHTITENLNYVTTL